MLTEALIQEKVLQLLKREELYSCINEKDIKNIENLVTDSENFVPSFSIDKYIRRRIAISTDIALKSLQLLEVLTADKNISVTQNQVLRPDIVCINPETQTLVIFELKKSAQAERQALTELLAYEHEIKNMLPFLSNYDTSFVLISTDWSVLLQHAAASAIAWSGKNLLCLKLNVENENINFNIVQPDAWNITGTAYFPKHSISSANIYLYDIDSALDDDEIKYRSSLALDYLAREADRAGLHGFAVVSEDFRGFNERNMLFTICAVSPFSFFKYMLKHGQVLESEGYLVERISCELKEFSHNTNISSLMDIAEKFMYPVLKTFSKPMFEGLVEWEYSKNDLEMRAIPFEMEFWGILGDYARSYVLQPSVIKHRFNSFPAGKTHWKKPATGLLLLNNLYTPTFLRDGQFRPSDVFRLGLSIGTDGILRENYKSAPDKVLESLMFWHTAEIVNYLEELALYVNEANDITHPVTPLDFHPDINVEIQWMEFINWLITQVFKGEDTYCYLFYLGLNVSIAIRSSDLTARPIESDFYTPKVRLQLCSFLSFVIERSIDKVTFNESEKEYRQEKVKFSLGIDDFSRINNVLEALPFKSIALILDDIFVLADLLIPSLWHNFEPINPKKLDWDNLKRGIDSMYRRGLKYPAIYLDANGAIGTIPLDTMCYAIFNAIDDTDKEVYVLDSSRGFQTFTIVNWEELRSGKYNT